jgi:hypothetical protein
MAKNKVPVKNNGEFLDLLVNHVKEKGIYRTIKEEPIKARRLKIDGMAVPFISKYKEQDFIPAQKYFDTIREEFYLKLQKATEIDFGCKDR